VDGHNFSAIMLVEVHTILTAMKVIFFTLECCESIKSVVIIL